MSHFKKLENMYLGARFNTSMYPSTTIKISEGEAVIGLQVSDQYFHALNAIHGSVYFKLLDDAAFFAANSVVKDVFVLTTNFNINIVRPVHEGQLKSVGKLKSKSRSLIIAEAHVYDEQDQLVAFGTGHFMRSRAALNEGIGYK